MAVLGTDLHGSVHRAWLRWKHPRVLDALEEAERTQWRSPDEIADLQWRALKATLNRAFDRIPFYAGWFRAAGALPGDITDLSAFARLPVLRKETIRTHLEEMRDPSVAGAYLNHTGGSTGHPLSFYQDPGYKSWNDALTVRFDRWAGWEFGERTAIMWGAERDLEALQRGLKARILTKGVKQELYLNAFRLDDNNVSVFVKEVGAFRPSILRGYVSALVAVARSIERGAVEWPNVPLRGIISAAETLTPSQREIIERVFRCRVFNRYGSRDAGMIAAECEAHDGLHIATDNVYLELLPVDPAGAEGEVVLTTLRNSAMPLIRYAIDDTAVPGPATPCSCRRGLPRLAEVRGRVSDMIVLRNGRSVHGEYFTHLFYGVPGVRQFQVIQESGDRLRILIVAGPEYDRTSEQRTAGEIRAFLGLPLDVVFEHVIEIPPTPTGKHRFTMSNVASAGHAR